VPTTRTTDEERLRSLYRGKRRLIQRRNALHAQGADAEFRSWEREEFFPLLREFDGAILALGVPVEQEGDRSGEYRVGADRFLGADEMYGDVRYDADFDLDRELQRTREERGERSR
jgi:hypothetical protein